MLSWLLILACAGDSKTNDSPPESPDDSAGESGLSCEVMNSGDDWYWSGGCPQMRTPCDIVVSGCSLTIDYEADGGMTMGMPYEGSIEGSTVTFADGDSVTGCVGTLEDADTMSGTCDGGCTFSLQR